MSKNLLTESTVRRFMKLANVGPLGDSFINERYTDEDEKDQTLKEVEKACSGCDNPDCQPCQKARTMSEQVAPEEEMEMDLEEPVPEEAPIDVAPEEPEMMDEPEAGPADLALTEEEARILVELGRRLEEAMDEEEVEMEEPAMEEPAMEEPPMEEPEPEDAPPEELVQEVLRRVTKRILKERVGKQKKACFLFKTPHFLGGFVFLLTIPPIYGKILLNNEKINPTVLIGLKQGNSDFCTEEVEFSILVSPFWG